MTPGTPNGDDGEEFAPLADINVTPFIDVMLVLLIIFMVTAPMLATGMKVELPKAAVAKPLDNPKPVVITLGPDGQIQIGDRPVAKEALVAAALAELAGADGVIQLRADQAIAYGNVVGVLDTLIAGGLNKVALVAGRPKTPAPPP